MTTLRVSLLVAVLLITTFHPPALRAQTEMGDAPEGAVAYPSLGIAGNFPTCFAGPAGYISHGGTTAFWGATVDTEFDGNAAFCPQPPYDRDECDRAIDPDAGLSRPIGFTIDPGLMVITCSGDPATSVGSACGSAFWGPNGNIEMEVSNFGGAEAYINIWFDWNQDGEWGGQVLCPGGGQPIDEHVAIDVVIQDQYTGLLSGLLPGGFQIGPNDGYVWARFTISNPSWQIAGTPEGGGDYDEGETEDYLLRIDPAISTGELGDAPEDEPAYPGLSAVKGQFPTCVAIGPAGFVYHANPNDLHFGPLADTEADGNAGLCPQPPYDEDECDALGGDSGLIMPDPYSIDAGLNIVACPSGSPMPLGDTCDNIAWGADLDIDITNNLGTDAYLNVLVDLNRSGEWSGNSIVCGGAAPEHVLVNFPIPSGHSGAVSTLAPPGFELAARGGYVWCRFTLSETLLPRGWDGSGYLNEGETEDYLFAVATRPTDAAPQALDRLQLRVAPNPFNPSTRVSFELPRDAHTRVTVHDVAGRLVRTLLDEPREAGHHVVPWNGVDATGTRAGSGIYVMRIVAGGEARATKVVMTK